MNACELLLMRARARRAYCKKCRVHYRVKKLWLAKCTCLNTVIQPISLSAFLGGNKSRISTSVRWTRRWLRTIPPGTVGGGATMLSWRSPASLQSCCFATTPTREPACPAAEVIASLAVSRAVGRGMSGSFAPQVCALAAICDLRLRMVAGADARAARPH
jgi:hypothetical protein